VSSFFSSKNKESKLKEKDKEKDKAEKVEKEKDAPKDKELSSSKQRPSVAQMPHPASFSTLYQLHQMQNGMLNGTVKGGIYQRHHSQPEPYMWHAKSYENGIGKCFFWANIF
jgi:hypothetical protein